LEQFVQNYFGAVVAVSHDRGYLESCTDQIIELSRRHARIYPGPYSRYRSEKEKRWESALDLYKRQKEEIARTEDFIRRNLAGQKTKQAQSRRKQLEKLQRLDKPDFDKSGPRFGSTALSRCAEIERSNKEVLFCSGVSKSYGENLLFEGVELGLYRDQKIGLIGPNGSGKTTLLSILRGALDPDGGEVRKGNRVRVGFFEQEVSFSDFENTVFEEISAAALERQYYLRERNQQAAPGEFTPLPEFTEEQLRAYAGRFLFSGDEVFRKVKTFSGGEQNRIRLMTLLLRPFNCLILDEPTNHLDLPAREALEETLREYDGTLLIVSHDRYFIDAVCSRLWVVENRKVYEFPGSYADFLRRRRQRQKGKKTDVTKELFKEKHRENYEQRKQKQRSLERLERQLDDAENSVVAGEERITALKEEMAAAPPHDWQKCALISKELAQAEQELEISIAAWEKADEELSIFNNGEES
jgi:ATP-binding cassette subfamily F protein 3